MKTVNKIILILLCLLLSTKALVAQEGYWVLESVTYLLYSDSDKSNNYQYTRNYITGEVRHTVPGINVATLDGNPDERLQKLLRTDVLDPVGDAEEIARRANGFAGGTSYNLGKNGSRVTWSEPPHKIKIGEERKVTMDATLEVSEKDEERLSSSYDVSVTIRMKRNEKSGWYPQPDRMYPGVSAYEDIELAATGNRSIKAQPLWTKDHPLEPSDDHMGNYTLIIRIGCLTYHYKCVPKFKEVTTVASDDVGEDPVGGGTDQGGSTGGGSSSGGGSHSGSSGHGGESTGGSTEIPWDFIVGGAIGVAVIGAGSRIIKNHGNSKKNPPKGGGKKSNNQEDNVEEKQEEQQPQSSFRMILYKDFGSTLMAGEWKQVGARIEEVNPQGQKIERLDLTRRIGIAAEEGCVADGTKQHGKYMMANVTVARNEDGSVADHAKVKLTFNGPRGVLVNHVLFNVIDQPEIVIPEALTFEAEGGKTQYIEFGINRYQGQVLGVKVAIEEAGLEFFSSKLEPDKENPLKFRINITERGKLPEPPGGQAQQQEKVVAGDAECYNCTVKVQLEGMDHPVTESFQIYRMYLGVRLDMHALKAYLVDYGCDWKHDVLATDPKRQKKWGESYTALKVFAEDRETGEIRTVIPDADPVFTFEDVQEGGVLFADRNGNIIQSVCDSVQFKYDFMEVLDDNTILGVIHSTVGGLLPPNRSKAKVTVEVSYNGKVYTDTEVVAVTSQPYRIINDEREYSRALKEDEEKLRHLSDLRYKIQCDPRFAELTPFYYKVDAMIDGYDARFGLYEPDYEKLMDVFDKYCRGEIGNYFVNETAWQPRWTLSEEYFNAFLATFGEMEKSTTGIVTRIALGFFTAGASELVLTPLSATRHMKEYVDKGGDSAVKAFVIASADVLFWEGVFYVGGKAVKWGAGKAKDLLDSTATGQKIKELAGKGSQKLKEAYTKLKESVTQAKNGKAATKELASAKEYSTRQLSERVKAGSEKVAQVKKASVPRANDAIRKTRMKGDAVYTQKSQLMEECSKQAREDAQQIIDNFKKVVNNPTASPEEVRRATLAIQGNKSAQNLLRNSPSDLLRANYNQNIEQIYKEVDGPTLKKLASRLKVADGDVRIGPQASGNAGTDLYLGKKIAADRDVTYQVRDKFGKWVDIQEDLMEEVYGETFFEYYFGSLPANKQRALDFLKKFDQAVVNGATGLESYGDDLGRIINKELQTSKLIDPERVAQTFEHKCMEFINAGKKLQNEAEQLFLEGFEYRAKSLIGYGEELIQEGIRQNVKQFKRILDPRIQALVAKGVKGKDFSALYQKIRILEGLSVPPSKEVLPLASVEEARLVLKDQFNTTLEEVIKECASIIKEVNDCL